MTEQHPDPEAQATEPQADTPQLIAQDGDLWVLYKPAGWVVHAAEAGELYDLQAWICQHMKIKRPPAPIHRLDRDTSGVVLYAASDAVAREVGYYFAQGTITKVYTALVHGHVHKGGVIRLQLDDQRRGHKLDATTHYEVAAKLSGVTLLTVTPETGRKHQIRRHLQAIGHAIVGDTRYRSRRARPVPGAPDRLWLHAGSLTLPDGRTFTAPLAPELLASLADLGGPATA
jgi:23S rRNA-/tRNA-specific pseudouridylate synthase